MTNLIIIAVVLIILAAAISYIVKAKRQGVKCIGCPVAGTCSHGGSGEEGCSCNIDFDEYKNHTEYTGKQ